MSQPGQIYHLRWNEAPGALPWLQVTSHEPPMQAEGLHDHEFCEVFWSDGGPVRHRLGNGQETVLQPGVAVFIRPDDIHGFCAIGDGRVFTCAIPAAEECRLADRYGCDVPLWPWRRGGEPVQADLGSATDRLAAMAMAAHRPGQRRLDLDTFILALLSALAPIPGATIGGPLPLWLDEALTTLRLGPLLRGGVPALVNLSGRSAAHVTRSVRRHCGVTPTALINRMRMERAGKLLRHRGEAVAAVAADVGIPALGHFYRLFRAHYGVTPERYRQGR